MQGEIIVGERGKGWVTAMMSFINQMLEIPVWPWAASLEVPSCQLSIKKKVTRVLASPWQNQSHFANGLTVVSFFPSKLRSTVVTIEQEEMHGSFHLCNTAELISHFLNSLSENLAFSSRDSAQTNIPLKCMLPSFSSRCRSLLPRP